MDDSKKVETSSFTGQTSKKSTGSARGKDDEWENW
jgi:hypothetical protein